jgi:hypothetical protein
VENGTYVDYTHAAMCKSFIVTTVKEGSAMHIRAMYSYNFGKNRKS